MALDLIELLAQVKTAADLKDLTSVSTHREIVQQEALNHVVSTPLQIQ